MRCGVYCLEVYLVSYNCICDLCLRATSIVDWGNPCTYACSGTSRLPPTYRVFVLTTQLSASKVLFWCILNGYPRYTRLWIVTIPICHSLGLKPGRMWHTNLDQHGCKQWSHQVFRSHSLNNCCSLPLWCKV